jgi:hypothetical protein
VDFPGIFSRVGFFPWIFPKKFVCEKSLQRKILAAGHIGGRALLM